MKAPMTYCATVGLVAAVAYDGGVVQAFYPTGWRRPSQSKKGETSVSAMNSVSITSSHLSQQLHHLTTAPSRRRSAELRASADPSAPRKKSGSGSGKRRKVPVKQAVEQWSSESLELHRFNHKRVHVCNATTLPDVLYEFWSVAAECAQAKYKAMEDDRDYAAHVLFVVPQCNLLKDYGMMRHLDKVIDFCSGGCADFGRTVTLQHYHPDFVLPPSKDARKGSRTDQHATTAHPSDLARVINFSRSPFPALGLTVASGCATRMDPIQAGDKIGRLRLDLEMLYNSVSGCSTEDTVDAHGSEHGTIPPEPEVVMKTTQQWLSDCADEFEDFEDETGGKEGSYGRYLSSAGDFVVTGVSTPEEVFSEVWSIVSELQAKVAPVINAERGCSESEGGAEGVACGEPEPLESTLLVAPRLHSFNAALFENLARTLGIALKQTPIMDRIEVEVYHPEFVCDSGVIDPIRRSPFPTLLIKHCGLKDELFEPSGMYRHAVPPLQIPLEALEAAAATDDEGGQREDGESGTANEVSADDAQI